MIVIGSLTLEVKDPVSVHGLELCRWPVRFDRRAHNQSPKTMSRILKPGPRPYIALGVVLGAITLVGMLPVLQAGKPWPAMKAGGSMLALYGAVCLAISRQRVVIQSDSVAFKDPFKPTNLVRFSDISKSIARTLAEPEHPVGLDIFTHSAQKPALRLRLKPFRHADVVWLLSIPELKVQGGKVG